jgi:four helix bundle protein
VVSKEVEDKVGDVRSYQDLRVWQQGIEIVKQIYRVCREFPKHETYGLASQMQRAAISIPSNIAEGCARLHRKEFIQFLSVALGSCAELTTQVIIAKELEYLNSSKVDKLFDLIDQEGKQVRSLIQKLTQCDHQNQQPNH